MREDMVAVNIRYSLSIQSNLVVHA